MIVDHTIRQQVLSLLARHLTDLLSALLPLILCCAVLQLRVVKAKKTAAASSSAAAARKGQSQSGNGGSGGQGSQGMPPGLDKQTFDEINEISDQVSYKNLPPIVV